MRRQLRNVVRIAGRRHRLPENALQLGEGGALIPVLAKVRAVKMTVLRRNQLVAVAAQLFGNVLEVAADAKDGTTALEKSCA